MRKSDRLQKKQRARALRDRYRSALRLLNHHRMTPRGRKMVREFYALDLHHRREQKGPWTKASRHGSVYQIESYAWALSNLSMDMFRKTGKPHYFAEWHDAFYHFARGNEKLTRYVNDLFWVRDRRLPPIHSHMLLMAVGPMVAMYGTWRALGQMENTHATPSP